MKILYRKNPNGMIIATRLTELEGRVVGRPADAHNMEMGLLGRKVINVQVLQDLQTYIYTSLSNHTSDSNHKSPMFSGTSIRSINVMIKYLDFIGDLSFGEAEHGSSASPHEGEPFDRDRVGFVASVSYPHVQVTVDWKVTWQSYKSKIINETK